MSTYELIESEYNFLKTADLSNDNKLDIINSIACKINYYQSKHPESGWINNEINKIRLDLLQLNNKLMIND